MGELGGNGEFGHIYIFFDIEAKGEFYMIVGFFSLRSCVTILFSLVTISIFILTRGVSGTYTPSTPSPPEIRLTPSADTPYPIPYPYSCNPTPPPDIPKTSSRDPTSRTSNSFSQRHNCDQIHRFFLTLSHTNITDIFKT